MIFPLSTDRQLRRTPWVNISFITINALIFLFQANTAHLDLQWAEALLLDPVEPRLFQFISYQFLHGSWQHILFNMLFLYVFGNSLEDRLGRLGYLFFYLAGGIVAGLGHVLTSEAPVLGASGSVSAVTGAFLALFPRSHVTLVYWFIIIGQLTVPSMWLILFSIAQDLIFATLNMGGNVAYLAHLSGNLFGFVVGMGLLATRVLPREPYDFLALVNRWRQRRQMKAMTREGGSPWVRDAGKAVAAEAGPLNAKSQQIAQRRREVAQALAEHQPELALDAYERLSQLDTQQVMPRQQQLDLANYAMTHERHHTAARAYEAFAEQFASDEYTPQVLLILGLIYVRYLKIPDRARPFLEQAVKRIDDPARREMAQEMLEQTQRPLP
ncbi:MAG: rhomboid family intramembrane serine protease [Phycisphaeraceae bacterium]